MKEQHNQALIESLYAAFGRGDIPFILKRLTSDVEWTMEGPSDLPFTGTFRGPEGVLQFFQGLGSTQSNQKLTMTDVIAQGDKVAGVGRYAANVKSTGKSFDSAVAHYFVIRDGKVARFYDFINTHEVAQAYQASAAAAR